MLRFQTLITDYETSAINVAKPEHIDLPQICHYLNKGGHILHHGQRVQNIVALIAQAMNLPQRTIANFCLIAKLHDIGKIGVPNTILNKKTPLTTAEKNDIQQHCAIGYWLALSIPKLKSMASWILMHHEWWDGSGYPLGLAKTQIPLPCRLIAVADAYDAMTSHRVYRRSLTHQQAVDELKRCAGTQFDPQIVQVFLKTQWAALPLATQLLNH